MLKVVNDHCADCGFYEVLVLEALTFLEFEREDDLVGFEKSDRTLFDLFKPGQHRIYISCELDLLLFDWLFQDFQM